MAADRNAWNAALGRVFNGNVLFSALVELTYRCNLDCAFCYNDLALRGRPLTLAQYMRFFEDLRSMQTMNLTLTGGEPLAHPEFFRLGSAARELGFVVRVKSNGHALGPALARRLRDEVDPYAVDVSLHGAAAATHDRQTRVPGSFERLMANLREMRELGLRLKLNCTLTAWNEHEVEGMFAIADGLDAFLHVDPEVTPRDDGDREPLALRASREGIRHLFEVQQARFAERSDADAAPQAPAAPAADDGLPVPTGRHCGAGSTGVAVDPYGNVYPCVAWRRAAGNLHERSIREIWSGNAVLEDVRERTADAKTMLAAYGAAGPKMAFCPGLAATSSGGDPLALYPGALQRAEVMAEVEEERKRSLLPSLGAS